MPDADTAILTRTNDEKAAILNMLEGMPELKERVSTVSTLHGSKGLEFDRVIMILNTIESEWGRFDTLVPVSSFARRTGSNERTRGRT